MRAVPVELGTDGKEQVEVIFVPHHAAPIHWWMAVVDVKNGCIHESIAPLVLEDEGGEAYTWYPFENKYWHYRGNGWGHASVISI